MKSFTTTALKNQAGAIKELVDKLVVKMEALLERDEVADMDKVFIT